VTQEYVSKAADTSSTAMPIHGLSSGSGTSRLRTPSPTDSSPPTRKMPRAARNAQKNRSWP